MESKIKSRDGGMHCETFIYLFLAEIVRHLFIYLWQKLVDQQQQYKCTTYVARLATFRPFLKTYFLAWQVGKWTMVKMGEM